MTIRLDGVGYTYAGSTHPALEGIDLEVVPGRVLGVVGPNDAGKSTLCLVASGLAPGVIGGQLRGRVQLGERDTTALRPHEAASLAGPMISGALAEVEERTLALEARAFGSASRRTVLRPIADRPGERLLRWAVGLGAIAAIGLAVTGTLPLP